MIRNYFSQELYEKFNTIHSDSLENYRKETKDLTERIAGLLAEYEASKICLAELEDNLNQKQLGKEFHYIRLKDMYIDKGMKSTEAKEHANEDCAELRTEISHMQRDISLLKANIHFIEYKIRLNFILLKSSTNKQHEKELHKGD